MVLYSLKWSIVIIAKAVLIFLGYYIYLIIIIFNYMYYYFCFTVATKPASP